MQLQNGESSPWKPNNMRKSAKKRDFQKGWDAVQNVDNYLNSYLIVSKSYCLVIFVS